MSRPAGCRHPLARLAGVRMTRRRPPRRRHTARLPFGARKTATTGYASPAVIVLELADHMNGRIYDPLLGQFFSTDTFLKDAGDLTAYQL